MDTLDHIFDLPDESKKVDEVKESAIIEYEEKKTKIELSKDGQVDINKVSKHLVDLMDSGTKMLASSEYIIESEGNSEAIAGAASLITSIKDVVKVFEGMYSTEQRFQRQVQMEQMKHEQKKELLKMKLQNKEKSITSDSESMVPFNQEDVIKLLSEQYEADAIIID